MSERLLNKVAVITGAGGGIGRAIAERFLGEGAKVVVFGNRRGALEELAELAPARLLIAEGDVTRLADLQQLVVATSRRFGDVDVLVPAAELARLVPLSESSVEVVTEQLNVNFTAALETVRIFLPSLVPGSAVLFITACPTPVVIPELGIHHAIKAALGTLAQSLAVELSPREIRVNCIAPGPTAARLWENLDLPADVRDSLQARMMQRQIPGECCGPDDVAEAAVFLASDAARNIVGQNIVVDGGYTIG